jgi:16S rRNA (uracil1498-N3)-methyltransferase
MHRFFVAGTQVHGRSVVIDGEDATHLARSLRARPGETVVVVEDGRLEHGVVLETVSVQRVAGRITATRDATGEPALAIHVVQSIPARGMDDVVDALSLAGATGIWPVISRRSVARPDAVRARARTERWRAIAREAAQLAGRARAPSVHAPLPLGDALGALPARCRILACVIDAPTLISAVRPDTERPLALVIGPEGGLDAADRASLRDVNAEEIHLGPRVMPSRLAGFLAVSLLLARTGELDSPVAPTPS